LVGALAGLVPVVEQTPTFWGLEEFGSIGHGPPWIGRVAADSPAGRAGFRPDDRAVAADGAPMTFERLSNLGRQLKPGEAVRIRVKRAERETDVLARGERPQLGAVYYPTAWHPALGGVCLALGLLVFATQPLRPPPLWRAALVTVVGLATAAGFFVTATAAENPFLNWVLWYRHRSGGAVWQFGQGWVGLGACLVLALAGAWEVRGIIRRRAEYRGGE
jgi:hypothetical protein